MNHDIFLLGAHVSIAGGLYRALERATSIGCNAAQIFTKNNRQWNAKPLTQEEVDLFRHSVANSPIRAEHIFAHATYLINIGSVNPLLEEKSLAALIDELQRCAQLGITALVLHPGSYTGSTRDETIARISKNLARAFDATDAAVSILLETTAGQGSVIGSTFTELATILAPLGNYTNRLGICLDTCHVFAAGYSFGTQAAYKAMWKSFDAAIGLEKLRLIHLNDSQSAHNSHVDRHQNIGKGLIECEAFSLICNDAHLANVPKILETPIITEFDFVPDMDLLRSLRK